MTAQAAVLALQRGAGNRATGRLLARKPSAAAVLTKRRESWGRFAATDEAVHPQDVVVSNAGTVEKKPTKVPGGSVVVGTGADYDWKKGGEKKTGGVSVAYTGKDAERTRWLQFIWREVIEYRPDGKGGFKAKRRDDAVGRANGQYKLTADPKKPDYNTDSSSTTSPFFEVNGSSNRTADGVTLFDAPDPRDDFVAKAFADKTVHHVESVAHLVDYLVHDMEVVHRVDTAITWRFDTPAPPIPVPTFARPKQAKAAAIDSRMRERLLEQYKTLDLEWVP